MKQTISIFLLGALLGGAVALGLRAVVAAGESKGRDPHAGHEMEMETPRPVKPGPETVLLDLGNEICPIMKKKVNGVTYTEWNGVRVGHCCMPCSADLLEDPETLLDAAGIEWREAAKLAAEIEAAEGAHRDMLIERAKAKYEVVRTTGGSR